MLKILVLICILKCHMSGAYGALHIEYCTVLMKITAEALEVIPERPELEYYNPKYIRHLKLTIGKYSRHSPHYIDLDVETLTGCGNNITIEMSLLEYLSGRYQPTLVQAKYKLCDFLYKEPFLGQMYAKQLTGNWTCPFPTGEYHFHKIVIHLENFPFKIPFTWASASVMTRCDVRGYHTVTNETMFRLNVHVTVTQKPEKLKGNI